jgi:hypothetical protein
MMSAKKGREILDRQGSRAAQIAAVAAARERDIELAKLE